MQLSPEMIIAIAVALVGAIGTLAGVVAVLWRKQSRSQRQCERDREALQGFIQDELLKLVTGYSAHTEQAVPVLRRLEGLLSSLKRNPTKTASQILAAEDTTPQAHPALSAV